MIFCYFYQLKIHTILSFYIPCLIVLPLKKFFGFLKNLLIMPNLKNCSLLQN